MTSTASRLCTTTTLLLVSFPLFALPLDRTHAQEIAQLRRNAKPGKIVYNPPKDIGAPRVTLSALSRGECNEIRCLMALMPNTLSGVEHYPQTTSAYPTFFFNVPKFSGQAEFRLYEISPDSTPKRTYKKTFAIASQSSIMSFRVPQDAPALKVGKFYRWEYSLNNAESSKCVGLVRRVSPVLQDLDRAQPLEKASIYANAGIWFEAVETLAVARRAQPRNPEIEAEWVDLLRSVKLDAIISQPISSESLSLRKVDNRTKASSRL